MKKWIVKNKFLFFILVGVFVLIIVPLCVYGLSMPPIFQGGGNDWSGFWGGYLGAIISAVVAIYGISVTLQETRRQSKEDKRIEHAPLLKIFESETKLIGYQGDANYILDQNPDFEVGIRLIAKNIGLGPVTYFEATNFRFINIDKEKCRNFNAANGSVSTKQIIDVKEVVNIPILIALKLPPIGGINDGLLDPKRSRIGALTFDIIYNDIFENQYRQGIKLNLNMNTDWTKECINDVTLTLSEVIKAKLI